MELKSEETMGKKKIEETEGEGCDMFCCPKCGFDPCKWVSVGKALLPEVHEFVEQNGGRASISNAQIRFFYYHEITCALHGHLGARNRRRLPECIVQGVRTLFPNKNNIGYVGHKDE